MLSFAVLAFMATQATQGPLWDVQKLDDQCLARAVNTTSSGTRLYIQMQANGSSRLEMVNSNWSAVPNRAYSNFTFNIDGRPAQGLSATGMRRNGQAGISFTLTTAALENLAAGRTVSLVNSETPVDMFSLSGSTAAINGLKRCQGELQTAAADAAARAAQRDPFAAANATAAPNASSGRAMVISNPQWSRPPIATVNDFPQRALDRNISGSATVECTATPSGRPAGCRVTSESHPDIGFGEAAIRIVQRGQLSPRTIDGAAVNSKFTVRVPFTLTQ